MRAIRVAIRLAALGPAVAAAGQQDGAQPMRSLDKWEASLGGVGINVLNNATDSVVLANCFSNYTLSAGKEVDVTLPVSGGFWLLPEGTVLNCGRGCAGCFYVTANSTVEDGAAIGIGLGELQDSSMQPVIGGGGLELFAGGKLAANCTGDACFQGWSSSPVAVGGTDSGARLVIQGSLEEDTAGKGGNLRAAGAWANAAKPAQRRSSPHGNVTLSSRCCKWPFVCGTCHPVNECKNTIWCSACDCDCCNPKVPYRVDKYLKALLICQVSANCHFNQEVTRGATSSSNQWSLVATASAYATKHITGDRMGAGLEANFKSTALSTYHAKTIRVNIGCSRQHACYIYQCIVSVRFRDGTVVDFNGPVMHSTHAMST